MRRLQPFLPALILAAGCALMWDAQTQAAVPLGSSISTVLSELTGYRARDQIISAEEQRIAGMTNYVARTYHRENGLAFTTLVSYYDRQTQGKTIHSPRNCLPGAGWEIESRSERRLLVDGATRTVNRYVLRKGTSRALVYYWYQGRGRVTANEYRVKWNLLRDAALTGRTEEALVRMVVPISGVDRDDEADTVAATIAPLLMKEVERVLPTSSTSVSRSRADGSVQFGFAATGL